MTARRTAFAGGGSTLVLVLLLSLLPLAQASAQSVVRGQLRGSVTGAGDQPLEEAYVEATNLHTGAAHWTYTDRNGVYDFPFLPSGEYDVRAEALGFRPTVVPAVRVLPGQVSDVPLEPTPATPPVVEVDTVPTPGGATGRTPGFALWLQRGDLERLPDRRRGLAELAALATNHDRDLGIEGLPGSRTTAIVDGVPFTPTRHPLLEGSGPLPTTFPRIGIDHVGFLVDGGDVEWSGGAGGQVAVSSRAAAASAGFDVFGAGSALPLWGSDHWQGPEVSSSTSFWGGGAAHVPLARDSSRLLVAVEGAQLQTPRVSPLRGSVANEIGSLPDEVPGLDGSLASPWMEEERNLSALARLDWSLSPDASVLARVAVGREERADARFFGAPLEYGITPPFEGTDVTAAAAVDSRLTERFWLEVRAGFEYSDRIFEGTEGVGSDAPVPPTRLVGADALLGPDPALDGWTSHNEAFAGGTVHFRIPQHWLKAGVTARVAAYDFGWVHRTHGEYRFGSAGDLAAGRGYYTGIDRSTGFREFSLPEVGAFVQHRWDPVPGVRLTTGLRYDREFLPTGVTPDLGWEELTGLRNDDYAEALDKVGLRLALDWDLTGTGTSILRGTLGAYHDDFDPRALNDVFTLDGSANAVRGFGGGLGGWPGDPGDGAEETGAILALLGPGIEAPRTARASAGLSQRIGDATTLHVNGSYRRTQYLLRRTDLNLPVQASGTTDGGRDVYGPLRKEGALVAAVPGENRRFSDYDVVWGLTADGWSEYQGLTVALEHRATGWLDLFASYTASSTDDNWVGASRPDPEARLVPIRQDEGTARWAEGPSDFDVPHRAAVGLQLEVPVLLGATFSGLYRFRSDRPFTPGYPVGVDVNADGSGSNDPAFVPERSEVRELAAEWSCLSDALGGIVGRNACRGPGAHFVDLRAAVSVLQWGGSEAEVFVDALNLLDARLGVRDRTLLRIDDDASLETDPETGATSIPVEVNRDFGEVIFPMEWGRMFRIGVRMGVR